MGELAGIFGGQPAGPSKAERDRQAQQARAAENERMREIQEGLRQETRRRGAAATSRRSITGNFGALRSRLGS